jgi:hypothetical protein
MSPAVADVAPHGAADQRVVKRDACRIDDAPRGAARADGIVRGDEVEQAVEVSQRAR